MCILLLNKHYCTVQFILRTDFNLSHFVSITVLSPCAEYLGRHVRVLPTPQLRRLPVSVLGERPRLGAVLLLGGPGACGGGVQDLPRVWHSVAGEKTESGTLW